MAEPVLINGEPFKKRSPIGVLVLAIITLGVYYFYWYFQINDELRRYERDDSISPTRSLMAVLFGWIIIVPPFIALFNTAKHISTVEARESIQPVMEPVLVVVFQLLLAVVNPPYIQWHMNKILDRGSGSGTPAALPPMPSS